MEKLRYLAVMEYLQGTVKVNTIAWRGGAGAGEGGEGAAREPAAAGAGSG
jgi:hypothetical protein